MACNGSSVDVWGKSLTSVAEITHCDISQVSQALTKTPKSSTEKGYKFFTDSYVHNIEVKRQHPGCQVKAKCYRSMKKNENPHTLMLTLTKVDGLKVENNACSCTAGKGFCQHQVALLYQLSHYQKLKIFKVPEIVSSTSAPQKWHVPPRTHGIPSRPVTDVNVLKPTMPSHDNLKKRKMEGGIRNKVYNPVNIPLTEIHLQRKLLPAITQRPNPSQWLMLWSRQEEVDITQSAFGPVFRGSLLSYHEKPKLSVSQIGPDEPPPFDLPTLPDPPISKENISPAEQTFLDSLTVTLEESLQYEKDTRNQDKCSEWHKLRQKRITASTFQSVTNRRGRFEELAKSYLTKDNKTAKTGPMQRGIDLEDTAAKKYADYYGLDIHKVGFVINPSASHLGCSPDRRVYDPDATPQWGLLEVKCSTKESKIEVPYLKSVDDELKLKKGYKYYQQCIGQMGISGAKWCDFYVLCEDDFHCERIPFDECFFYKMKEKLDVFYYNFILRAAVNHH